jgi:hypothetical protein
MSSVHRAVRTILAWGALCALLSGCVRSSAPSIPPNVSSSDYRRAMVQWHQQHDRRPAVPAAGP